jgi:hypothetical protein
MRNDAYVTGEGCSDKDWPNMPGKGLVALVTAATLVSAFSVLPADARAKKEKQYRVEKPYRAGTISLDGRNTGRARTCGYDTFLYDELGVPTGPYCH